MKPLKKIQLITTLLVMGFLLAFSSSLSKTHAFDGIWSFLNNLQAVEEKVERLCTPTKAAFKDIAADQTEQSIVRFSYNYEQAAKEYLVYETMGISRENIHGCMIEKFGPLKTVCSLVTGFQAPANCDAFGPNAGGIVMDYPNGLLGLVMAGQDMMYDTQPPLSLAYYFDRQTQKIPFVGKALAAGTPSEYKALYLKEIFYAWELIRDLSYAALAIIMLVIGIMIASRRKVNAQAVVTIQYAIPRVVIAIILVTFSYPIGATIANLSMRAAVIAPGIVYKTIETKISDNLGGEPIEKFFTVENVLGVESAKLIFPAIIGYFLMAGAALGLLIGLIILVVIALLVVALLALVKFFIVYLKMIFSILLSPLVFTISAIPGNDEKVENWFKQMLAYTLSMIAIPSLFLLSFGMGLIVAAGQLGDGEIPFGGMITQAFTTIVFMLGGLLITIQAPKKIEEGVMGTKKR